MSSRTRNVILAGIGVVLAVVVIGLAASLWTYKEATPKAASDTIPSATVPQKQAGQKDPAAEAKVKTPTPTPTPTKEAPAKVERSKEEVEEAVKTVTDAPKDPDQAVSANTKEFYGVDLSEVFPKGTKVDVDKSTWTDVDETTAMVLTTITRPGQQAEKYTAVLGKSNGKWTLLGTLPFEEGDAGADTQSE